MQKSQLQEALEKAERQKEQFGPARESDSESVKENKITAEKTAEGLKEELQSIEHKNEITMKK